MATVCITAPAKAAVFAPTGCVTWLFQQQELLLQASRDRILECEADYAEMHHLLTNLPPLGALSPDELARRAAAISQQCPPKHLLRKHRSRLVKCANSNRCIRAIQSV